MLKKKLTGAILRDGTHIDIAKGDAVAWFDLVNTSGTPSFVLETPDAVWLGVDKSEFQEKRLRQIGGSN